MTDEAPKEGQKEGQKAAAKPALSPEQEAEAAAKRAARAAAKAKPGKAGGGKGGKGGPAPRETATERVKRTGPARLRQLYETEVKARLMQELGLKNPMQVPKVTKVVINMGLGEAVTNPKILDSAVEELAMISGQQPVVTASKKAIAAFKLKANQKIGAKVTLRRDQMYEFLDRLVSFALPRVRDFKGVSPRGFDGRGNYTLGVREGLIFPEVSYDRLERPKGMNITIATNARTDEAGRALLRHLGMPFRS
jgi:large subunit ribosomal protein L5